MRSWRWWLSVSALPVWGAILFLAWAGADALANRALAREMERLRVLGQPLVPAQAAPPAVPDQDNGAFYLLRAMAILKPSDGAWDRRAYYRDWSGATDLAPLAELWVSANAPALDDLKKAAARPACRLPIDYGKGAAAEAPGLLSSGLCAELLACAARLAHERGDPEEADLLLAVLLRIGLCLGEEPTLGTSIAGLSVFKMGFELCQEAFDTGLRPGRSTRAFIRSLRPGRFKDAHVSALLLERSTQLAYFLGPAPTSDVRAPVTWRIARWGPLHPYLKWDLARYLRIFRTAVDAAREEPDSGAWARPSGEEMRARGGWLARSLLPHFPTIAQLAIEGDVYVDLLRGALEAIEISETSGTWPSETGIVDRFTGRPLSVRLDAGMLTVSSAGPDLIDDGGHPGRDIVLTLGR